MCTYGILKTVSYVTKINILSPSQKQVSFARAILSKFLTVEKCLNTFKKYFQSSPVRVKFFLLLHHSENRSAYNDHKRSDKIWILLFTIYVPNLIINIY